MSDVEKQKVIRAYKNGKINRDEAVDILIFLEPQLLRPIAEILLLSVTRQNVFELKQKEK